MNVHANYFDALKIQFAGEIGTASLGVTQKIKPWYDLTFMFGLAPRTTSHTKSIETYALKQDFFWGKANFDGLHTRLYTSLNIYHVTGIKHQTSKFRNTPEGYYPINSVRALLALGINLSLPERPQNSYFFEMGMNDLWIVNCINNKSLNPSDYVSMAIGINYNF